MGRTRTITSRDNPTIKALRALAADAREIRRQGRTLLDGPHLIEAYRRHGGIPEMLVVSDSGTGNAEVNCLLDGLDGVETLHLPDGIFREISGVATPVGILALIAIPEMVVESTKGSCVMLDAVQDAGNVGAILRTAAAAGVTNVLLGSGCAGAWTPRVLRAAQGAHFALHIREQVDLVDALRQYEGKSVATVASGGRSIYDLDLDGHVAWIFGNEGVGVDAKVMEAAALRAMIPIASSTESLNVAAAAAICLFEGWRQRHAGKREEHG